MCLPLPPPICVPRLHACFPSPGRAVHAWPPAACAVCVCVCGVQGHEVERLMAQQPARAALNEEPSGNETVSSRCAHVHARLQNHSCTCGHAGSVSGFKQR